jgi:hypothetical protein
MNDTPTSLDDLLCFSLDPPKADRKKEPKDQDFNLL